MPLHLGSSSCPYLSLEFLERLPLVLSTRYSYRILFSRISTIGSKHPYSSLVASTGLGFRPASRREERRGENGGAISGKSRTKLLSPGKKVNRTTDRKRRRWSNVFPPSLSEERSSLRAPVHSFSSSLPLAGKKKKGLDRIEIEEREREDEGETKIPPRDENGACWTVGKMTGRVYNSTRTDGRWFVLSSGRTLGCRQKNYYA